MPIWHYKDAANQPMPFGMYRGKTIAQIAAQPFGEDYLLWAASTWSHLFLVKMICLYLGYCPLPEPCIDDQEPDIDDNPF